MISDKKQVIKPQAESGFTILETAVASMLMLVGIMAVMQLFAYSMVYNKSSSQTTIASTIAKRQMERLLAMPLPGVVETAPLGYGGALGDASKVEGYYTNFYVDFDRNGQKGTMRISATPFYTDQPISYVVTWLVETDNVTVNDPVTGLPVPAMPGIRRITVQAEATQSGMQGLGVTRAAGQSTNITPETAVLSMIRTPHN